MKRDQLLMGLPGLIVAFVIFIVPFVFIFQMAGKSMAEASLFHFSWPTEWHLVQNFWEVIQTRDYQLVTAYINSTIITAGAVFLLVMFGAMVGYVLQRRPSPLNKVIYALVLAGFMIPPAIVPTIWILKLTYLFKSTYGMILIEVAYGLSFSVLLYRSFIASIPKELDEAAIMDGASPISVFFRIILPLLKPVTIANVVIQTIFVFNDFTNPLYYMPGKNNITVQVTLYNYLGQFQQRYNLLFMDILLVTIPPFLIFLFFNKQIVAGMTGGAVKG